MPVRTALQIAERIAPEQGEYADGGSFLEYVCELAIRVFLITFARVSEFIVRPPEIAQPLLWPFPCTPLESTLTSSVNSQWAQVDKMTMQQAAWAPYLNQQGIDTFGSNIDLSCYVFHVNYQFDFSTICHK